MENRDENIIFFEHKKIVDDKLNAVVGGTNTNDEPKYHIGDIVYILIKQTPPNSNKANVVTLQCRIICYPTKRINQGWYYDVGVLAQDVYYEGCPSCVGKIINGVSELVFEGTEIYMAENGISFK